MISILRNRNARPLIAHRHRHINWLALGFSVSVSYVRNYHHYGPLVLCVIVALAYNLDSDT